jgi:acyl-CoA dehydrogenase
MADSLIVDTATRIFADLSTPKVVNDAEAGMWPAALWDALAEAGLPLAWVPEDRGGAGAALADGFAVCRIAGQFAAPVPLAETLLAGWLLSAAAIDAPDGPMTVAPVHEDGHVALADDGRLVGRARDIPFARHARNIAVLVHRDDGFCVALVATADLAIGEGTSLAGEPRGRVVFDGAAAHQVGRVAGLGPHSLARLGAAIRTQQMAGALERILAQSVQYAMDRKQFGRPIAKFQAIQHTLATLAGETAAASAAADAAAEAIAADGIASPQAARQVAIAKLRVGEAAGIGAAIAHQVHGAMGFTYEHTLHHSTRRLWAWREEFGNEAAWARTLGRLVAAEGADRLWDFVTAGS